MSSWTDNCIYSTFFSPGFFANDKMLSDDGKWVMEATSLSLSCREHLVGQRNDSRPEFSLTGSCSLCAGSFNGYIAEHNVYVYLP